MKIEEIRTSFTVYLIASEADRLSGLGESLGLAGYMVANFTELTAAFSEFYSNPPHFVVFDYQETRFNLKKAIAQVAAQLPESHILMVTPIGEREKAATMLEEGVYDLILTPLGSPVELVRALDRAAERDYFMYLNERLAEQAAPPSPVTPAEALSDDSSSFATGGTRVEDFHLSYAKQLFDQRNTDDAVGAFLQWTSSALGSCPVVFMKYIANRRVLIAAKAHGLESFDTSGLGVNFNEHSPGFRTAQLRDPKGVVEIVHFVKEIFQCDDFFAVPVDALGELQGVVLFLRSEPGPSLQKMLNDWIALLDRALSLIEAEKRLHVMCTKDPATDLLNRQNFLVRVREEVSRARRTSMPVSLALLTVDQYGQIVSGAGQEEAEIVLKMAARIFEKHSRINDIIGRTGADEFGLVLPHTGKQGALIKAERLRRIIESADFSRVVKAFPNITISLGVSEYPSMVRDADELMQSADEALYQIRADGNKTCVAKPPDGFVADFEVREKGL